MINRKIRSGKRGGGLRRLDGLGELDGWGGGGMLLYTVITARTVYQFYLEVALFHSELSGFFSIKCFPDLERNISRS